MVKRCSVCSHASTIEINRSLLAGVPYRELAAQYGLSPSALCRHVKHIDRQRQIHHRQQDLEYQENVMEKLALLDERLTLIFHNAVTLRSLNVSLGCVRESLRLLSLSWSASAWPRLNVSVPVRFGLMAKYPGKKGG